MTAEEALARARVLFLREDHAYGCAETTLMVLQEGFALAAGVDPSPALALNGGVAWHGGLCGASLGAALAVGQLAAERIADHGTAKRVARAIVDRYLGDVERAQGAVDCREVLGRSIRTAQEHAEFIQSGIWRNVCWRQIEFAVRRLIALGDPEVWQQVRQELEAES